MNVENLEAGGAESGPAETPWDRLRLEVPFAGEVPESEADDVEARAVLPELPTKSQDRNCGFWLRQIERTGTMPDVKTFLEASLGRERPGFASEAELEQFCEGYTERLETALSADDEAALKAYSGFGYKYINQVARGFWDYELLGPQTPEKMAETRESIEQVSRAIAAAPALEKDLTVQRGTNLDSFRNYNIHSLAELAGLKNQFFLESGFTSTSLDPERSFADRANFDDPLRKACNITVEYLLPAGSREVVGLFSNATSYSPEQREVLIDQSSLSYVTNVELGADGKSAKMQMVLIPRQIYDPATR